MSWVKRIAWMLVILGIVLVVVWAARLAAVGLSLREHLAQAQALADDPQSLDPVGACSLVRDLRGDVTTLRRETGGLIQLAPLLGWLPGIGGELRAAPHLLDTADGLTEAGALTCDALGPALASLSSTEENGLTPEQMIALLDREQPALEQALAAAERAQAAWERVDTAKLSPWLAGKASVLNEGLPLLQTGLQMATVAPDLLGADGPRTYLILAQNDDELRPTGGFISGAGALTVEQGHVIGVDFIDANLVDDYLHKPYPEPPQPLFDTMGSEIWLFRDANWSPDFPTSARQAAYFYEYGQGVSVDGVIALNQHAVELLIAGLGEVHIPGVDEPVTAANVRQFMREAWNPGEAGVTAEWTFSRKDFIGQMAAAILGRIESDPGSVDWVQTAKGAYQALQGHHLLIVVDDADASTALARAGWDGAIRGSDGDYLMAVDANLGFGKVNALIDGKMDYRVALRADGTASAELSLTYTHRGQWENVRCVHMEPYAAGTTYAALMHRCYYDYLRIYVPAGSVLRAATPHPTPGEYLLRGESTDGQAATLGDEAGKTVFAQFFVVEYGQALTTRFEYDLPQVVQTGDGQHSYTLLIQKQGGTDATPVSVTVALPPNVTLLTATPPPKTTDANTLTFDLQLAADVLVEVTYE
ncbi:MAG: DUF4012 domain-containing protein [Anaerolineae bacterium]|nr:DUF4012 domain-containing protein [Anaerolineae bacterium]